jgi:hypothetical protein
MSAAPDFIEVYPDALAPDLCRDLIARFDASTDSVPGRVGGGVFSELKDSRDLSISGLPGWADLEGAINQAVFAALLRYVRRYPHTLIAPLMLEVLDPASGRPARLDAALLDRLDDDTLAPVVQHVFRPGPVNLQRYSADRGGYPYWHCELYPRGADAEPLHRHLLWTLYLNDGFGAGETEFLYQKRRIEPRTGSVLLAPTAFTHTHRGNTPERGDKYIATGWILFRRAEQLFGG